jgi:hypothetical protein
MKNALLAFHTYHASQLKNNFIDLKQLLYGISRLLEVRDKIRICTLVAN